MLLRLQWGKLKESKSHVKKNVSCCFFKDTLRANSIILFSRHSCDHVRQVYILTVTLQVILSLPFVCVKTVSQWLTLYWLVKSTPIKGKSLEIDFACLPILLGKKKFTCTEFSKIKSVFKTYFYVNLRFFIDSIKLSLDEAAVFVSSKIMVRVHFCITINISQNLL